VLPTAEKQENGTLVIPFGTVNIGALLLSTPLEG
jgi:hypothetical protein